MRVPTLREARRIWRDALRASLARQRERASSWLREAWARETAHACIDSVALVAAAKATARSPRTPEQRAADTARKRRWRSDPANREHERERDEARRRARGVRPREKYIAEMRELAARHAAEVLARRRERERARSERPGAREADAQRQRERRAAMTLEERRAEWVRHQRAKRERDRRARESSR
jgi:hypothetical protein